ncbi:TolB family protein [Paenibacillus sp. GCM10023250]|uniref:TolB family protein n=1 Tax=Paenibacillus sp. GCM10023250 TaxID=3252648 RepID=UPI00361739A7
MKRSNEPQRVVSILETVDVRTGERVAHAEFDERIEAPNWTRDGKLLYNSQGRLFAYDLDAGAVLPIDSGFADRCNNDHVLSPDHERLAVSHHTREDGKSRIYILSLRGGEPVLVTPMAPSYLHGWSPDGRALAYCGERNGEFDIYVIPASGGVETRLTNAPGLNDGPEYSPDGRHIWFNSVRTGLMQLWRMNADGSSQTQMTFDDDSNSWFPHVSPDGRTIAYLAYRKGDVAPGDHPANKDVEIRLMPSEGGAHRTLASLFGGQGTLNVHSWSPDGSRLAFVSYRLVD